jgi:hypothetical protein
MPLKRQIIFASAITLASLLAPHLDVADVPRVVSRTTSDVGQPIEIEPVLIKTGAQH